MTEGGEVAVRPRVVVFDVNETLFSLDRLGDAFEEAGLPGHALDLWFARVLMDGFALASAGRMVTFRPLAEERLRRALRSYGLDHGDGAVSAILDRFPELEPYGDVRPALERLRDAGVTAVTLTNGSAGTTRTMLESNGLDGLVDRCFDVEMAGRWKPAPEPYELVAREYGAEPAEVALVAVHSWDVLGAEAVGLTTAWVARLEGEPVPQLADPDVTAPSLVEAVDALLSLPSRP